MSNHQLAKTIEHFEVNTNTLVGIQLPGLCSNEELWSSQQSLVDELCVLRWKLLLSHRTMFKVFKQLSSTSSALKDVRARLENLLHQVSAKYSDVEAGLLKLKHLMFDLGFSASNPNIDVVQSDSSSKQTQLSFSRFNDEFSPEIANQLAQHFGTNLELSPFFNFSSSSNTQKFELRRFLKKSIYGAVRAAFNKELKKRCAIKISDFQKFLAMPSLAENFLRESRMISHLQPLPPSIVQVQEIGCNNHEHWIAMEFMEGGELLDHLQKTGPMSELEAKRIFNSLLESLEHCHSRNLAHMDVSAENILLDQDGNAKLCDFGQARLFLKDANSGVELPFAPFQQSSRSGFGTKWYCRPIEMLLDQPCRGTQVDMFSAGAVLYIMLQGIYPYENDANFFTQQLDFIMGCSTHGGAHVASTARGHCKCEKCKFLAKSGIPASCRISAEAAEAISRMMCIPEMRATLDEVRVMSWFSAEKKEEGNKSSSVCNNASSLVFAAASVADVSDETTTLDRTDQKSSLDLQCAESSLSSNSSFMQLQSPARPSRDDPMFTSPLTVSSITA